MGGEELIEPLSNNEPQRGVTQELKPLVRDELGFGVLVKVGAMDEGLAQEGWVLKGNAQAAFQFLPVDQRPTSMATRRTERETTRPPAGGLPGFELRLRGQPYESAVATSIRLMTLMVPD